MKWIFGHSSSDDRSEFKTKEQALAYLRNGLPQQDFRYLTTYARQQVDSIIFSFAGELLAELVVENEERPTPQDKQHYRKTKKVYRIREIRIFKNDTRRGSEFGLSRIHYGLQVSDTIYKQIIKNVGGYEKITPTAKENRVSAHRNAGAMLTLLESREEKEFAQLTLDRNLRSLWRKKERRRVVWRPDSRELKISHNGEYWFVSVPPSRQQLTPRYWNSFGSYRENGNLQITVEINISVASNERRVSGFFAKDSATNVIYLMHDGAVGGGRRGIGKSSFLAWSGEKVIPVSDSRGSVRFGIVVASMRPHLIGMQLARFTKKVLDFKQAVKNGEVTNDAFAKEAQRSYDDYYREFSGKKKGKRAREFEYISRHGDIVDALRQWRGDRAQAHERIIKNAYIDLGVTIKKELTEIYEVKTNADRQALYTAIGQTFVHGISDSDDVRRYIVLPDGEEMPQDVMQALKRLQITVLRFEMNDNNVRILEKARH